MKAELQAFRDLEKELGEKLRDERDRVESSLPKDGILVICEAHGPACDSPIFSGTKEGGFAFDTYGRYPPNYRKWRNVHSYGMCGLRGDSPDIKVVASSVCKLNKEHRVGLCGRSVIDAMKEAGFTVEEVEVGFR